MEEIAQGIRDLKEMIAPTPVECAVGEPSKQALFSALVCEYTQSVQTQCQLVKTCLLYTSDAADE